MALLYNSAISSTIIVKRRIANISNKIMIIDDKLAVTVYPDGCSKTFSHYTDAIKYFLHTQGIKTNEC